MDHKTLDFQRTIKASAAHVYHCLTDASARVAWNSPDETMVFRIADPQPVVAGGRETGKVGPAENPYVTAHADWIVTDPAAQLAYAETLEAEGTALSTSLVTAILQETDGVTDLSLQVHIVSLTGPETIDEVAQGWDFAVDAMAQYAVSAGQ